MQFFYAMPGDLYQLPGVNNFSIPLRLQICSQGQRNNISIGRGKVFGIIFRGKLVMRANKFIFLNLNSR